MSFSLTAKNIEDVIDPNDDPDYTSRYPTIVLTCWINNIQLFEHCVEGEVTDWERLADACKQGNPYGINWIEVIGDYTEFSMEKSGDGQGGSIKVFIPARDCIGGFRAAAKLVEEWTEQRKLHGLD